MKRLLVHLVVALGTFSLGILVTSVLRKSPLPYLDTHTRDVERVPQDLPVVSAAADLVSPVPEFVLDYDPAKFNPRGTYYILGRKPKGLREFDCFELVVEGSNGKALGKATFYTKYFGKNKDYHITTGNGDYIVTGFLTKRRLAFVAKSKSEEDFEFRFDGHFLRKGTVSDAGSNTAVLKGRLTKLKNGAKMADREVKFRVEYLGC